MKLGLVSISFRELSAEQIIQLVAECGLQGIEWGGDVHVPHGDLDTARKVAHLTNAAGLEVASYGSYYRFEECDPTSVQGIPSMDSVLETAESLGAPAIRVWAGTKSPDKTSPALLDAIAARAREFAEKASARGIRLDFEYHENTLTETPESTIQLLESIDHSNAHSLWQPPLLTSTEKRLEGLERIKPWISNVHCNHFGQEPWPHVQALKDGASEWKPYLKALADGPADRWVLIEHVRDHSPEQFPKDAAALKEWLAELANSR